MKMIEEGSDSSGPSNKLGIPAGCNPSDVLYKLAHSRGIKPPVFEMISEQGPPHARTYTWSCSFWDGKYQTMAAGRSKKEAKNAVAKALLDQIDTSVLPTKTPSNKQRPEKKRKGAPGEEMAAGAKKGGKQTISQLNKAAGFFPGMAPMGGRFGNRFPLMRPRNTKDDHQVITKHRNIYPSQEELGTILKLAETVERALKRVSDKFANSDVKVKEEGVKVKDEKMDEGTDNNVDADKNGEAAKHENRDILGVARTGDLAKGLLLTGDRSVELVVMCKNKPTLPLLTKMGEALKEQVKTIPESEKKGKVVINDGELEVLPKPRDAALLIKYKKEDDLFLVTVTLTCTKLRQNLPKEENGDAAPEDEAKKDDGDNKKENIEPDPHDMLPKEKCLNALAELRRAKWFSTMAVPLESCVESIRIYREICRRVEAWKPLSPWAVELLVERTVSTTEMPLSPSMAFSRVLEAVSCGVLAPDGPGLKDPCEREDLDVVADLDNQQREDLMASAQDFTRKVHFRKIFEILDLPKPEYKKKKGAKEGGEGAEPAVKKIKTEDGVKME